ncbi:MAG: SixA phosphatase family protein [Rudaea sp.]
MELILWRHCDAEPGVPDDLRPLTARGREQATRMAQWLAARLPADSAIIVSPALRARETARALARRYRTMREIGTGASVDAVLAAAHWPHARRTVLVVGHQPTLGRAASWLLEGELADRPLEPGALLWLASAAGGAAVLLRNASPGSVGSGTV